ncbi:type II toxin-antitoxin system PemI/MazE family antitoxin [Enterococcus cecorum]|uniref:type II toxin-antitoxin system PemI/MazE family antitoxin n=1 Tax=Enterococcus cecorum TaxID=44008 RepID=UPI003D75F0E9
MNYIKTRKVGNSVTITLPKELNVTVGEEYSVYKGKDGTILLSPGKKDLLSDATDEMIREKLLDELGRQIDENYLEMKNGNYYTLDELEEKLFE